MVSVIIPVYNGERTIKKAIESVFFQNYKDWEIIIVDDGSTDKTSQIIKELKSEKIRYFYQKNQGRSKARNKGILLAKGEYIAFLDSDDVWLEEHLQKEIKVLESHPNVSLVYSEVEIIGEDGNIFPMGPNWKPKRYSGLPLNQLIEENFIPFSSSLVRKKCFEEIGLFDSDMEPSEDWDIWLRIVKNGHKVYYINEVLTQYRWKEANLSKEYQKRMVEGGLKVLLKFYKNYSLEKSTLKFWIRSYLSRINTLISFVYDKPFSPEIKRYFSQYPLSFSTLIVYPLFWKIFLKWIFGKKILFLKNLYTMMKHIWE